MAHYTTIVYSRRSNMYNPFEDFEDSGDEYGPSGSHWDEKHLSWLNVQSTVGLPMNQITQQWAPVEHSEFADVLRSRTQWHIWEWEGIRNYDPDNAPRYSQFYKAISDTIITREMEVTLKRQPPNRPGEVHRTRSIQQQKPRQSIDSLPSSSPPVPEYPLTFSQYTAQFDDSIRSSPPRPQTPSAPPRRLVQLDGTMTSSPPVPQTPPPRPRNSISLSQQRTVSSPIGPQYRHGSPRSSPPGILPAISK